MLQQIFETITPDNIKDNKLMQDSMEIFIKNLEKHSGVSIDISDVFNPEQTAIKEELINTYLDDLYRVFKKASTSPRIRKKVEIESETFGGSSLLLDDIAKKLDEEYFITSKHFKEKKGTKVGIEYIYNLADSLGFSFSGSAPFKFTPGVEDPVTGEIIPAPFQFRVEGSLYKEVYEEIVKPLAHPLGFTYIYFQILIQSVHDYFKKTISYKNEVVEIVCLSGYIDVYSMKEETEQQYKDNFLKKINPNTQELYTEEEYYELVTFYLHDIKEIVDYDNEDGKVTEVYFTDNTYIVQTYDPTEVKYWNVGDNTTTDTPIRDYTGIGKHCSMLLEYEYELHSDIADSMDCETSKYIIDKFKITSDNAMDYFIEFVTESEQTFIYDSPYIGFVVGESMVNGPDEDSIVGLYSSDVVPDTTRTATDLYLMQGEVLDVFSIHVIE